VAGKLIPTVKAFMRPRFCALLHQLVVQLGGLSTQGGKFAATHNSIQ
jgi:hypothetical protein